MAKGLTDARHYAAIAEVLRKNGTDREGTFQPGEMAEKLQAACDFRYGEGHNEGYDKGLETGFREGMDAGRQAEYDRFWDVFQDYGNRTDYDAAFFRSGFNEINFFPKYDLIPTSLIQSFMNSKIKNLKQILVDAGVVLDTSNCTNFYYAFYASSITHFPDIDLRKATNCEYMFRDSLATTIDKLIVCDKNNLSKSFANALNLENIVFEGTIGQNVDLHWSPLTKASIESVMAALSDTASGMTASFQQSAVNGAFTADEWLALVAAKPNWTITLA